MLRVRCLELAAWVPRVPYPVRLVRNPARRVLHRVQRVPHLGQLERNPARRVPDPVRLVCHREQRGLHLVRGWLSQVRLVPSLVLQEEWELQHQVPQVLRLELLE